MNIEDILRAASKGEGEGPAIMPEALVERMRERLAMMQAPNPYKVGDLVTVVADCGFHGAGEPHLVVGVNDDGYDIDRGELGAPYAGTKHTVQVLSARRDVISPHVLPHWVLTPYELPET